MYMYQRKQQSISEREQMSRLETLKNVKVPLMTRNGIYGILVTSRPVRSSIISSQYLGKQIRNPKTGIVVI
jgi:hypothetical protein